MSNHRDAREKVDLSRRPSRSLSRVAERFLRPGVSAASPVESVETVDIALARQEFLAAANASNNPLARAIIVRLAATLAKQEPEQQAPQALVSPARRATGDTQ